MTNKQLAKFAPIVLAGMIVLLSPVLCMSEFYQYTNKDGVVCFTDDISVVEANQKEKVKVHSEKYDGLNEEVRQQLILEEKERIEGYLNDTKKELEAYEEMERLQALEQEKELTAKSETPFDLHNNRVLLPVTLGYNGNEITTILVLDTGASITAVNSQVAQKLNISSGVESFARVADGSIIKTILVEVEYIKVGPKTLESPHIMVLPQQGAPTSFQGLLGQGFLKQFSYTIDYEKKVIKWGV